MKGFIVSTISVLLLQAVAALGNNQYDVNAVGECPADNSDNLVMLPHKYDCGKFFICNRGEPLLSQCVGDLHFDPNLMVCDHAERVGCENDGVESSESNEESVDDHLGQEVGQCPEVDGEYVTILPHKSDCTRFFLCSEGTPVVKECQPGLHFNPTLLVCDYPDQAGCGGDGNEGEPEESNEIPPEESKESEEEDDHLGQEVGECPEVDGEYVTILPHKSDCTRFFLCSEGTPVVKECQPGLHFNPTLLVCDYPDQAGCGGDGNEGEPEESNEIPPEESKESEEEDDHLGQEVGECPEVDGEYVTLLPHKSDCTRFFLCSEGTPVVKECQPGLHFNPTLLVCDYPDQAGCGGDGNEGEPEESNEIPPEESKESEEEDDHLGQEVGECPEVDGEYVTLLPHKSDCTRFFQCNGGTPVVMECYPGLHFNPTLSVCDYPDQAGCA